MTELKPGVKAPAFSLKDKDGHNVQLSKLAGEYSVVYFYPRDNTPGCTVEAQGFSADLKKFDKLDASIVGISGGDEKTKEKFCRDHKLRVTLVSDPDYKIATKYGCYGDKKFMGRTSKGIFRKTFVLDSKKRILKIYDKVKTDGHSREVLEFIKQHRRG